MALDKLRDRIDAADTDLLFALSQRMDLVNEVLEAKQEGNLPLFDASREADLLARVAEKAEKMGLDSRLATRILKEVISHSREVQSRRAQDDENPGFRRARRVGFQGTKGAYSWMACRNYFGADVETVGYPSFKAAFLALEEGQLDLALLPIENVLAGSIYAVFDLLANSPLHVIGEEILRVDHCLIGLPGTPLEQIHAVLSHPVALQQCRRFLEALPTATQQSYVDSAEAVRKVAQDRNPAQAAIASAEAADLYGLSVLREGISDHPENYTRFWVIAREPVRVDPRIPAKTSLLLVTDHREGALVGSLSALAAQGVNLTKLESRPRPGTPWQYQFHLEMEGNVREEPMARALDDVRARARLLRVLGCFPSATAIGAAGEPPGDSREDQPTRVVMDFSQAPLTSLARRHAPTEIQVGKHVVGAGRPLLLASTADIEQPSDVDLVIEQALKAGVDGVRLNLLRVEAGGWHHAGQLEEVLEHVGARRKRHDLVIGIDISLPDQVRRLDELVDLLIVPPTDTQNSALLKQLGRVGTPVLLQRGASTTVEELLVAAGLVLSEGNQQVILCECGIRTFETKTRSTLDLGAVVALKDETHLPVIVDPTSSCADPHWLEPLARAALAVGADGLVLAMQTGGGLNLSDFEALIKGLKPRSSSQ